MNVPETFFTVQEELWLFGLSCLSGAVMGLCYDVLRALRQAVPHPGWAVAAEDIIFVTGALLYLVGFSCAFARGEIRGYFAVGSLLGFGLYLFTLGSLVRGVLCRGFCALGLLLRRIIAPAVSAYVLLCKKVMPFFVGNSKVIVKSIKKMNLLLHKLPEVLYNKMENKKGKNVELIGEKNQRQN